MVIHGCALAARSSITYVRPQAGAGVATQYNANVDAATKVLHSYCRSRAIIATVYGTKSAMVFVSHGATRVCHWPVLRSAVRA